MTMPIINIGDITEWLPEMERAVGGGGAYYKTRRPKGGGGLMREREGGLIELLRYLGMCGAN